MNALALSTDAPGVTVPTGARLRVLRPEYASTAPRWTIAGGLLPPAGAAAGMAHVHTDSYLERVFTTGVFLATLEGVEGAYVEVTEWRGERAHRRLVRVWQGGSPRAGGAWHGAPWRTPRSR